MLVPHLQAIHASEGLANGNDFDQVNATGHRIYAATTAPLNNGRIMHQFGYLIFAIPQVTLHMNETQDWEDSFQRHRQKASEHDRLLSGPVIAWCMRYSLPCCNAAP